MKRLIIVGKGGSGKDHLRKKLQSSGFKYCVSHTTRPPREGEVNGEDYHFISLDAAVHEFVKGGKFYEYVFFNEWVYGTSLEEFHSSNLFIMTPSGLRSLSPEDRAESFVVYLDIDEDTRRDRLSRRNDADKLERRLKADYLDFKDFNDFDDRVEDPYFDELGDWGNLNFYSND